MALMNEIFGHSHHIENLLSRLEELPSSLIFYGPSGVGKKKIVRGLLQIINCSRDVRACGHCSSCKRSLEKKNEMILEIGLEEKKSISVDQIREIHEFISLKTISSARFVIIDPADKLTVQASNALLKMLEEAPEKTYFFMISETLAFMLPTIRSRSSIYRFQPLSNENLKKIEGVSPESVSWARGRADMALALSNDNGHEGLKEAQEMLVAIIKSHPIDWKKVFPSFFQNDNGRKFFVPLWEEMLKKKLRGESFDFESEFPQEDSALLAIFESVQNLRNELARSFDKPLCLENFYYLTQHIKKSPEVALWN